MTDVVLPCLNEAPALPGLLSRMPAGYRVIVADNGSTDGSAEVARDLGAYVVTVPQPGYGAAVHAGILAASPSRCSSGSSSASSAAEDDGIVCVMDADGSFDPAELPLVADPVRAGAARLVLGRRRPVTRGAWPPHARLGNAILASRLRRTTGLPVHDIGPMRAARRDDLLSLGLRDRRFGYPLELLIAAARAGWTVTEVDVAYHPRAAGTHSKVTGTVRGTARAIRDMSAVLAR
ncbi:glycosyltransferase family 2 protein [Winogradskya consettensis]|uniref:Glycosyl transferase n=1 Tax=Winogradskya consettensis TaxID=113560 RepID=A0A919SCI4_9ACTN|nr:glycosyltransferase family 2 protein [Actinoplanes consettensis]GIM70095.1 glycosyl transferase [Actinoplanes consettensis]